jgi:hypothetical protein
MGGLGGEEGDDRQVLIRGECGQRGPGFGAWWKLSADVSSLSGSAPRF